MPTYEFRCAKCNEVSSTFTKVEARPVAIACCHCGSMDTHGIVSGANVVLSSKSKVDRLDPKYDKMVDSAMSRNPAADPDRLLGKMRDPAGGRPDD